MCTLERSDSANIDGSSVDLLVFRGLTGLAGRVDTSGGRQSTYSTNEQHKLLQQRHRQRENRLETQRTAANDRRRVLFELTFSIKL
jgi:hypothetical protein